MEPETIDLFAYGTLLYRQVVRTVTGRCFEFVRATLEGYQALRVRNHPFPGLIPQPTARVDGVLWLGLDEAALELLDLYEGDLYQRRQVTVKDADGHTRPAQAYVVEEGKRHLLTGEVWDRQRFESEELARFLASFTPEGKWG